MHTASAGIDSVIAFDQRRGRYATTHELYRKRQTVIFQRDFRSRLTHVGVFHSIQQPVVRFHGYGTQTAASPICVQTLSRRNLSESKPMRGRVRSTSHVHHRPSIAGGNIRPCPFGTKTAFRRFASCHKPTDLPSSRQALASFLTTTGMAASRTVEAGSTPPVLEITSLLEQIPDIIFEIASHLPTETVLSLALTCKPLHILLFSRTLKRISTRQRHVFLFTLMRDLNNTIKADHYYCHTCGKIYVWRCPADKPHGPKDNCPFIKNEMHDTLNSAGHTCLGTPNRYWTHNIPPRVERYGKGIALHTERQGFLNCCGTGSKT